MRFVVKPRVNYKVTITQHPDTSFRGIRYEGARPIDVQLSRKDLEVLVASRTKEQIGQFIYDLWLTLEPQ